MLRKHVGCAWPATTFCWLVFWLQILWQKAYFAEQILTVCSFKRLSVKVIYRWYYFGVNQV